MITTADADRIANQLKSAQDNVAEITPFASHTSGFDLASAYHVADTIHKARVAEGSVAVGRKIGFSNAAMWPVYGVDQPIWGYLYQKRVVDIGRAAYRCALGRFVAPKIEPEIVLHFGVTPAPGADVQAILACVDWIAHGYEIVQSHYPDWKFQVTDAVADSSLHGELLLGERVPVARLGGDVVAALAEFSVELFCDGALREVGCGANVLGSPLSAIAHLSSVLAQQPDHPPLQAGEMVTTGTLTAAFSVSAGETWTTQLHGIGLPNLAVTFVP